MALSWCCKYLLAFLLGAMTLGLFIIIQLQSNTIPGVDIYRKNSGPIPSPTMYSINDNRGATMSKSTANVISNFNSEDMAPHSDLSKKIPVLREAPLMSNVMEPLQTKSANMNKSEGAPKILIPIERVLSRMAPEWDEPMLPPAQLLNVEKCSDKYCSEYLTESERHSFEECTKRTATAEHRLGPIVSNDTCHFQNGTNRHPVALASFPGSGNTWMRGLLQKITGICTGAIYCDRELRARGFTGESIRGPSVIAIKTHNNKGRFTNGHLPPRVYAGIPIFGAAILLVRDPKSALVAEWHRKRTRSQSNETSSSHFLAVGEEYFTNNKDWDKFVKVRAERWRDHVSGWIIAAKDNPFLVVRYEDLKIDAVKEMKKVMNFLGFSHISESEIKERLGEGYNNFYRNHKDDFRHYTEDQKSFVHQKVQETIEILKDLGRENIFPIHQYL